MRSQYLRHSPVTEKVAMPEPFIATVFTRHLIRYMPFF